MIFQYTYQHVLEGKKTETRRLIKSGEKLLDNPKRVEVNGRVKWQVGRTYAVQPGRNKKGVGRIRIVDIKKQSLGQMLTEDALAEGYLSLEDFQQTWIQIHKHFDPNMAVWIIIFTREPTPEEKARTERLNQENWLNQEARKQWKKLTAVGHALGEWEETGELALRAKCSKCEGAVAISAGKMRMVGYIPLMKDDECLADDPARMAVIQDEWNRRLAIVYDLLISVGRESKRNQDVTSEEK